MGTYDDEVDSAYDDIQDAGGSITIASSATGTWNPITETYTGGASSEFDTYGVQLNYEDSFIDNVVIKRGDIKFLVPAKNADFIPEVGHTLTTEDGSIFTIQSVIPLNPTGNQTILWEIQGRK